MKKALFIAFVLPVVAAWGQIPDYYVYLVQGEATIANPGKQAIPLKQKQLVFKSDVLSLKNGSELTLVDRNANYYVLKTPGNNSAASLVAKATAKPTEGVTSKYLKLVFHELLDPNHDFEKLKKENIAGVWGGVSRGDECGNRIYPVNGLQTSASSISFKWHASSPSANYQFVLYDKDGKEITKMAVRDTLHPVQFANALNGQTGKYFWRVTSADGDCEDEVPIYFNLLLPEEEKKLAAVLIQSIIGSGLESELQKIGKLEKNAFIDAASVRYGSLVKANPDNVVLARSYALFLLRYGFEEEARAAWKF